MWYDIDINMISVSMTGKECGDDRILERYIFNCHETKRYLIDRMLFAGKQMIKISRQTKLNNEWKWTRHCICIDSREFFSGVLPALNRLDNPENYIEKSA